MQTITAQIVNKALAGEPEHSCLQLLSTLKIYEFSQIVHTIDGQVVTDETLNDNDMTPFCIQRILSNGHRVEISVNENDEVTLHF